MSADRSKADQILDVAESMIRQGGFHAFSFRDIAKEVGLKSASVHYHFPTKEDLGAAVMQRYAKRALECLGEVRETDRLTWESYVQRLASLFITALENDGKLCLCGMLGAEHAKLPTAVVVEVADYVEKNIQWLEEALLQGGWTNDRAQARQGANLVFATLEGSMMLALLTGKDITLRQVVDLMLASLMANKDQPVA